MTKVYIISDLHLDHAKLAPIRGFSNAKEHDKHVEDCWRSTVRSQDVVYVLGDVAFTRKGLSRFRSFPGRKKIIMGNHDGMAIEAYLECCTKIYACYELNNMILTHIPIHQRSINPRYRINVHGHTHDAGSPSINHFSVCPEIVGYSPVPFVCIDRWAKMKQDGNPKAASYRKSIELDSRKE